MYFITSTSHHWRISTGVASVRSVVELRVMTCNTGVPTVDRAGVPARLLPQFLLLSLQTMEEVDDDVSYPWQELIQTRLAGFLAERFLENCTQGVWDGAKVCRVYPNSSKGSTSYVELIAQPHIDVRHFALARRTFGPCC